MNGEGALIFFGVILLVVLMAAGFKLFAALADARLRREEEERRARGQARGKEYAEQREWDKQAARDRIAADKARRDQAAAEHARQQQEAERLAHIAMVREQGQWYKTESARLLGGIGQIVDECYDWIAKAKTEYDEEASHEYWISAAEAFVLLDKVKGTLAKVQGYQLSYYRLSSDNPGVLGPFLAITGWEVAEQSVSDIGSVLAEMNHRAHRTEPFKRDFAPHLVVDAVNRGFQKLDNSLKDIKRSIGLSTLLLSEQLNEANLQLEGIRIGAEEQHLGAMITLTAGIKAATGAIDANHRASQKAADDALWELRRIRRRV